MLMCCWRAGFRDRCEGGLFGDFGGECVFWGGIVVGRRMEVRR